MAGQRLQALWPDLAGRNVLGFGFCVPYLDAYQSGANRIVFAMPGGQGALAHKNKRGVNTCLTEEDYLPFSDSTFDTILCVHGVEETANLKALMSELWRVCRPEGHIVIIASNRAFHPTIWSGALYAPPLKFLAKGGALRGCEKFGETVFPSLSGLILVEGIKRLYVDPNRGEKEKSFVARPRFGTSPIANRTSSFNRDKGRLRPTDLERHKR